MFIPTNNHRRGERRGVVLLVVIAMLALFAVLGLSFVYYAQSEADAALMLTQSQTQKNSDIDPEFLLAWGLGQLLYGVEDQVQTTPYPAHNVYSSMRGHDLARGIFGWNRHALNATPFNGVGRPSTVNEPNVKDGATSIPVDQLPNYRYFAGDGVKWFGTPDFIRDPGRYGTTNRNATSDGAQPDPRKVDILKVGNPYYGENVPYTTASDMTSFYLGQMGADGQISQRSFWRNMVNGTAFTLNPLDNLWVPSTDTANIPKAWKKYATLRPLPYFNPNFPPPEDGGGDVKNVAFGPGVSDGGTGYYRNDSIWIDLGFPVRIAPDGRRYKPLFAFFICDLDGKVNINASGNVRVYDGTTYGHGSHRGYTTTEINLAKVLTSTTDTLEWTKILAHRYGSDGKPDTAGLPWSAGFPSEAPPWGYQDADSVKNDPNNKNDVANKYYISEKQELPGSWSGADVGNTVPFVNLSKDTYQNGTNTASAMMAGTSELYDHPWRYNIWSPAGDDRRIPIAAFEALWRYNDTGSPSMGSMLFSLLPKNLLDTSGDAQKKRWRLLTPLSVDFARPGISPWLNTTTTPKFELATGEIFPRGAAATLGATNNNGEFGNDFRGYAGSVSSIRLNLAQPVYDTTAAKWRALTAYPKPDATGHVDTSDANLKTAIADRQQFAKNLFDRFRFVTTGARPTDAMPGAGPELEALRWLAQLSANMVDAIDEDNIMTIFPAGQMVDGTPGWNPADTTGYVVGTELPRLLINEAYAQIVNDKVDNGNTMATEPYKANFWVELINPLRNNAIDPMTNTPYTERLMVPDVGGKGSWSPYRLNILEGTSATVPDIFTAGDPTGKPKQAQIKLEVFHFKADGDVMGTPPPAPTADSAHMIVQALDTATSKFPGADGQNTGFYVLGPLSDYKFPNADDTMAVSPVPTLMVSEFTPMVVGAVPNAMTYTVEPGIKPPTIDPTDQTKVRPHTIVLRRLANPFMKEQNDPTLPAFNPYITVDYIEGVKINDGVEKDALAVRTPTVISERVALGRKQPYAAKAALDANGNVAANSQIIQQPAHPDPMVKDNTKLPKNTLFTHNATTLPVAVGDATLTVPFDWVGHLDRNVISPIELINVSVFRPDELTQRFIDKDNVKFGHIKTTVAGSVVNPRLSAEYRLYRVFEYLDAGWRTSGVSQHGRVPGKININTCEKEAFRAVCDANDSCKFKGAMSDDQHVDTIFNNLSAARPFKSLANAHTTAGADGIVNTILRDQGGALLFQQAGVGSHPTEQTELLSKIFNNITTRSNVFAVWLTVGFFEVNSEDANGNGILDAGEDGMVNGVAAAGLLNNVLDTDLLGKEIGRQDNRHVRHRMFAIVDRTALMMPKNLALVSSAIAGTGTETVDVNLSSNPIRVASPYRFEYNFYPQAGMTVDIDTGANRETVTIQAVDYTKNPVQFSATFTKPHALNAVISVPLDQAIDALTIGGVQLIHGNPGPQQRFDHRHSIGLVPYYSIIQ